jgi:integrative and conjugative element protein (TIGR02256 family)
MEFTHLGLLIKFTDECLEVLSSQRQTGWRAKETGGQLFARFTPESLDVTVATITKGKSRRTRFGFYPDRTAERADVISLFSQGLHYLGDWHTHPQDLPTPSATDERELRDIFINSRHELPFMLLVVVGTAPLPAGIYIGAVTSTSVLPLASNVLAHIPGPRMTHKG